MIALLLLLFLPTLAISQPANSDSTLQKIAQAYHDVYGFTGAVKIVDGQKVSYSEAFGLANRETKTPFTTETPNSINSISKTFTAFAILKGVEQNRIDLNQTIGHYIPELMQSWKDSITIHHLLSHTSGLPREAGFSASDKSDFADQVNVIDKLNPLFSAGKRYQYSNAGFSLLGSVLERSFKKDYATIINEVVLNPLALTNTGVYEGSKPVERQAIPYKIGADGIEEAQRTKTLGASAGGGLYSTINDLYDYTQALFNPKLVSEEIRNQLFSPHYKSEDGEKEGYAWAIKPISGVDFYMATGSGYGTKSVILFEPTNQIFIGIVSNWGNTPILDMLRDFFLTLNGQTVDPPQAKQLAKASDFMNNIGAYSFDAVKMKTFLQKEDNIVRIKNIEGKVFMDNELLSLKEDGNLGLTYTNEVSIRFEGKNLIIKINDNTLIGTRLE